MKLNQRYVKVFALYFVSIVTANIDKVRIIV